MTKFSLISLALLVGVGATAVACSSDDDTTTTTGGTGGSGGSTAGSAGKGGSGGSTAGSVGKGGSGGSTVIGGAGEGGAGGAAPTQSLCDKYGGTDAIAQVMSVDVIPAIANDCKINVFFTSLSTADFKHVGECLTTQVQELFGCDGVTYGGSKDSSGATCRSMKVAHTGLGISKGDFDALLGDVVAGLTKAGVSASDIAAAAPALLNMESDIEEAPASSTLTQDMCVAGAGGALP